MFDAQTDKITDIQNKAAEAENSAAPLGEPGTKAAQKKGPGRPKGSTKTESKNSSQKNTATNNSENSSVAGVAPSKGPPTSQLLAPVLNMLTAAVADVSDLPEARMTEDEVKNGSEALGMLVDKWFPNGLDKYGPEIFTIMVFSGYGLRVATARKNKKIKEARSKPIKDFDPPNSPGPLKSSSEIDNQIRTSPVMGDLAQ